MTIYVVMGTRGDYSDRTEWAIVAYTQLADAQAHIAAATAFDREIRALCREMEWEECIARYKATANPFDPCADRDRYYHDEPSYFYYETELKESRDSA